jgi:glycosyltransferase involved in cell wall biosynthesis
MDISIVIPALNEEQYLPKLFECLGRQTKQNFEVIVADAESTDFTTEIARSHGATVVEGGIPAVGRNRGAAHAKGDFIFFLDADIQIPDDFIENATNEIENRSIDLATAEAYPLSSLTIDKIMHKFANIFIKLYKNSDPRIPGYCILIRRKIFEKIGGFDEKIQVAEDHDLVKRATELAELSVLRSTHIKVSVRRFVKEGRIPYIGKSIQIELYRSFNGEITDDSIEYQFGNFEENNSAKKTFIKLEKKINKIDEKLNRQLTRTNAKTKRFQKKLINLGGTVSELLEQLMR